MDMRRLISAVLITLLIVFAYQAAMRWYAEQMGWDLTPPAPVIEDPATQPATQPTTVPATRPVDPTAATVPTATAPGAAPADAAALRVVPATQPAGSVVLGSIARKDETYRLGIEVVPIGASVGQVVLNEFTREVDSPEPYVFQRPPIENNDQTRSLATRAVIVDGTRLNLENVAWTLESSTDRAATFAIAVEDDSGPILRIRKSYEIFDRTAEGAGYEVAVAHAVENLTDRQRDVKIIFNGTVTPPREIDRGPDRYIVSGYDLYPEPRDVRISVSHHAIEEFSAERRTIDISRPDGQPSLWAGAVSVYFVAIVRPIDAMVGTLDRIDAVAFNPDAPAHEREAGIVFETANLQIDAGQSTSLSMRVFFGPRQRGLLQDTYYAQIGYNTILVLTGGPCAYCTFQWLIDLLVLLLRFFHTITSDWGLAIVLLVILVRVLLHPITKKSQVSMMKMAKFGPELERLRKKYGDNKEELNKAMMGFYKEQGFSPVLGCLPMFLQMPIWIALWSALHSTFELRHAAFLWGYTWINDLAKPDHLIAFERPFNLWFLHISGFNLLPILMGVVFYLQMKLQPRPIAPTKEQEQQQKIMMWMMPLLFPIMLYSGPSGLNLYILTSTFIGIIESKRIRDHIKRQDEAEAQQKVVVDAAPTRGMKRRRDDEGGGGFGANKTKGPKEPKTGLAGWLANLQQRAAQVRREAERKGK